ncbi:MAG: aminopeptidase P family protein [Burkholderiaceae bacterium]
MDTLLTSRTTTRARITRLRAAMVTHRIDAYIVPSSDPHLSEYLPDRWQSRRWLSGFTGSVGTLVLTADFAGLWVDGRYWSQAEAELAGTGLVLMKISTSANALYIDWLAQNLAANQTVGADGAVLGLATARLLRHALQAKSIMLCTDHDLVEDIWIDRPGLPTSPIYEHLAPYAGRSRAEKLADVRAVMKALDANTHFISTLDDIAYLFNLRGADVHFNPIFVAHALIDCTRAILYIADGKVPPSVQAALATDGVEIDAYENAAQALAALSSAARLLLDPRRITLGLRDAVAGGVTVVEAINPTTLAKARKSEADVAHVRATMEQDGAALCEFFAWLEAALEGQTITEHEIDAKITGFRAKRPNFVCASFSTIAAFNANGAMPHYHASAESHATLAGDGLLLIDSGGQYLGGTTDITRVVPVGNASAEQMRDFTLVLKGMIGLSRTIFPRGTRSPMLDAIARAPIWAAGIDYGHGTGHGVGYFLNVHEGPQVISSSAMPEPHTAMEPGMITSIEPGIYRPGQWGVRIENLVLNQPAHTTEFGEFLRFETLTLCPIDTRCIELSLLRADEVDWINGYHATVRSRLLPHVDGAARTWLEQRTRDI